ncbi:DM13 domain-containing protein [Patescibacteria group bacterium]|nr:DM13 domain-containing protein [Patescibacteria group bacterium]
MKNLRLILLLVLGLTVTGLIIYFFGFYTYFQSTTVNEALPPVSEEMMIADENGEMIAPEPSIIATGSFVDADLLHTGEGDAKVISYPDGKTYLRFENFSVVNGPDVRVYLSPAAVPGRSLESLGDYVDLGPLKGNKGDQNYELPEGADLGSVVLWCEDFGVLFPYASLTSTSEAL